MPGYVVPETNDRADEMHDKEVQRLLDMPRFSVLIRWRGYRWNLRAKAENSARLVCALAEHFPPNAQITVRPQ